MQVGANQHSLSTPWRNVYIKPSINFSEFCLSIPEVALVPQLAGIPSTSGEHTALRTAELQPFTPKDRECCILQIFEQYIRSK